MFHEIEDALSGLEIGILGECDCLTAFTSPHCTPLSSLPLLLITCSIIFPLPPPCCITHPVNNVAVRYDHPQYYAAVPEQVRDGFLLFYESTYIPTEGVADVECECCSHSNGSSHLMLCQTPGKAI